MTPPPPWRGDVPSRSYVHALRSLKDGRFYVGWTTDLERRLAQHNKGEILSTRSRKPFIMVGWEVLTSKAEAKLREKTLKHNPNMLRLFKKRVMSCVAAPEDAKEVVG